MYEINVKEVPNMLAITIRGFSNMQNMSEDMGKFYHELWDYWVKNGLDHDDDTRCFALYHGEFDPEKVDLECGSPLRSKCRVKAEYNAGKSRDSSWRQQFTSGHIKLWRMPITRYLRG